MFLKKQKQPEKSMYIHCVDTSSRSTSSITIIIRSPLMPIEYR